MSSSMAASELEEAASKYAAEAIRLDSQGSVGMAIQMYQKAIAMLIKLAKLYPDYQLNRIYLERAKKYEERVRALQMARGTQEIQREDKLSYVEPLKASYRDLVLEEKPSVKWDEVVGLEEAKRALRECIVFPTKRPDLFPLGWPRGILLYGPPGCGKTMLAAAVASEIDANFITVDAASIMSKWLGEAEKNVANLFNSARKLIEQDGIPAVIFIDEIDSLLGQRSYEVGGEVRVRNQFLQEMDGIMDKGKNIPLYLIGATNKPWALDPAFLRRFQKRIYVPLPDFKARVEMFKLYTQPLVLDSKVDLEELAEMTEGYSGSDIRDLCQAVQLRVVSELFESGKALDDKDSKPRKITLSDFKEVMKVRKPSVSPEMVKAYIAWSSNFKAL
ncbi:ATP-dependent zinc metalloprotease FtsH [archaeon HR06]|nr:ATP-dependent zinc metalloprotease FtsH [archaeon HR06]